MTGLIVIVLILSFTFIGPGISFDNDDGDGNTDSDGDGLLNIGELELSPEYDSLADVRVDYTVAGSVLTSWFYEDGRYQIVAYHGPDVESAFIVDSETITIVGSPTRIDMDYSIIEGGRYASGNGALGFKVTNNLHDTTVMVWVWEA